jgi:hypothetical protein
VLNDWAQPLYPHGPAERRVRRLAIDRVSVQLAQQPRWHAVDRNVLAPLRSISAVLPKSQRPGVRVGRVDGRPTPPCSVPPLVPAPSGVPHNAHDVLASHPVDRLTFSAEIVKALAWPVAAVVLALLVRGPLRGLIHGLRLKKVKRGDWEAEFDEAAAEVRAELPPKIKPGPGAASDGLLAELAPIIAASPTEAVLTAWKRLEAEIFARAEREGVSTHQFMAALNELVERKVIQPEARNSIMGLRQLRNLAVHGPSGEVSEARARDFLAMADATLWIVRDTRLKES